MSLAGCQINPIDVNFYLQKSLEIFVKNSADKIWSKKDKVIKVSPLMSFRVKSIDKLVVHISVQGCVIEGIFVPVRAIFPNVWIL